MRSCYRLRIIDLCRIVAHVYDKERLKKYISTVSHKTGGSDQDTFDTARKKAFGERRSSNHRTCQGSRQTLPPTCRIAGHCQPVPFKGILLDSTAARAQGLSFPQQKSKQIRTPNKHTHTTRTHENDAEVGMLEVRGCPVTGDVTDHNSRGRKGLRPTMAAHPLFLHRKIPLRTPYPFSRASIFLPTFTFHASVDAADYRQSAYRADPKRHEPAVNAPPDIPAQRVLMPSFTRYREVGYKVMRNSEGGWS